MVLWVVLMGQHLKADLNMVIYTRRKKIFDATLIDHIKTSEAASFERVPGNRVWHGARLFERRQKRGGANGSRQLSITPDVAFNRLRCCNSTKKA